MQITGKYIIDIFQIYLTISIFELRHNFDDYQISSYFFLISLFCYVFSLSPDWNSSGPSISPGCGSATGVPSGAISPGAQSQTSNAAAAPMQSCCENGRPIMTDPVSGQTVCSCQYDSARLALSGYSRIPAAGVSVYGAPYPSTDQNPYPSIGVDSSAFYSPLVSEAPIHTSCHKVYVNAVVLLLFFLLLLFLFIVCN